jgi:hypothetical protein
MSFRKNTLHQIKEDLTIATRKNKRDDIKDADQENRIQALETLLSSFTITNTTQADEIADLKLRLSKLESRYNSTFPSN